MNYYNPWNAHRRPRESGDALALREDVERRLEPACAHLTAAEFRSLVDEICQIKLNSYWTLSGRRYRLSA